VNRVGLAVLAIAFAVLAQAAAPGLYLRDSGELTTAAFTLGVAHETGFPLWCLLGKAASLVPLGEVATRVNLLSAACGAVAAWLVYRVVREAAGRDAAAEVGGVGAAALLLCGLTFFKASTVAEVYAPTAAAIALCFLLVQRASASSDRAAGPLLALVGGLSLGLHAQLRILIGPACAVWALVRLRRGDRWPILAPAALAVGAAVLAYLPLRAARSPAADWADPRTLGQVIDHVAAARIRRAYADQVLTTDFRALASRLAAFARLVEAQLGVPALLAAAGGLGWLVRRRETRVLGAVLAAMLVSDALYSAWVNPMGLDDLQDGAPTALGLALAAGCGVAAFCRRLGARAAPWAAGVLALCVAVPAALDGVDAKRGLGFEAGAWTRAALASPSPRALVLTTSDDLSAGVLYEQAVAGARPDVTALVRQQLWDGALTAQRIVHAGQDVRGLEAFAAWTPAERIAREDELERALVHHELGRRAIAWEPGGDAPPEGALGPGVPVEDLTAAAAPLPPARPLAESIDRLLAPGRDPMVRQLAAGALGSLGRLYLERGDDVRAQALYEAALGARPDDAQAMTNLAVVRARRGDFAGARELVTRVLEREPGRLVARVNRGRYRLALDDLDGARADFTDAHARAPRDPAPLVGLARVALRSGDRDGAARRVREALAVAPHDPEARALSLELKGR
jgi:tetratricopeptide (TPR) repeat protein